MTPLDEDDTEDPEGRAQREEDERREHGDDRSAPEDERGRPHELVEIVARAQGEVAARQKVAGPAIGR
jgi:hypothetical protein